ncbi:MAG TPA: hypothetical protein PLU35_12570 [Phycisphaerales bacterium]|nr:hypothetical protein [Phycisphaerales bacterium]
MPEQPTTLDDAAAGADDLQRQVDSLLSRLDAEEPGVGGDEVPPAPQPADAPPDERIEALDRQLAALSEELMEQDADDEPAQARPPNATAAPSARPAAPAHAPQATASREQAVESPAPAQPAAVASVPDPGAAADAETAHADQHRVQLTESVCAVLAGAVEPVAKRVSGLPRGVRDSIGWIGAMTLFYAACVWAVVLVLRGPDVAPPDGPPPEVASAPEAQPSESTGKN